MKNGRRRRQPRRLHDGPVRRGRRDSDGERRQCRRSVQLAAALGLRKNLTASFDRHVAGDGGGGKDESTVATLNSTKTKTATKKTAAASAGAATKKKKVGGIAISSASSNTTSSSGLAPRSKQQQLNEKPEFSPKAGGVRSRILQLENAAKMEKKRPPPPRPNGMGPI